MNKALVITLSGTQVSSSFACVTSVVDIHQWLYNGNSLMMDCCCFCILQEAIDIIERRIIPSDSNADFSCICFVVLPAAIVDVMLYRYNYRQMLFSGNSLYAELSLIVFLMVVQVECT